MVAYNPSIDTLPLAGNEIVEANPPRNLITTRQIATLAQTDPILSGGTITGTMVNAGTVTGGVWSGGSWSGGTMNTGTVVAPTISGLPLNSITNAITASTTQTLAGGTKITAQFNVITVANTGDAVTLPTGAAGQVVHLNNTAGSAVAVFPGETKSTIDNGATAASVTLSNGKNAWFEQPTATTWLSFQGGVKSA